jgi:dihydrofolate synthase/folylpolyglutamate synthase
MNSAINYLLSMESKGIKLGLERTQKIMATCGNPHNDLPVIQIAGTNGKGSVCAILEKAFRLSKYKTGLFTSPHLVRVNERIRINGIPIKNLEIEKFINIFKIEIEKHNITFFECITALSAWHFKKNNVDIAIMETGLGGRLDSVSICNPMLTIITPISYDHTEILGNSLKEIAIEKAGIMKKNIICISAKQLPEAEKTLKIMANKKCSPLYFLKNKHNFKYHNNIKGQKQKENSNLALFALDHLKQFNINQSTKINALNTVTWHGRNQLLNKKPTIVFDVGHNKDGILSFIKYYKSLNISGNSTLIIALYARKKIIDIISLLEKTFIKIICTETNGKNPMKAKALAKLFSNNHNIQIIENPENAIAQELINLQKKDGMAILGTHCLGPAISKKFNISFDTL